MFRRKEKKVNMTFAFEPKKVKDIRALPKDVLVIDMDMGEMTTASGIVIQSDDGKAHGVKPRWAKVYRVGSEVTDIEIGQWVLIEHGRWTGGARARRLSRGARRG